MRLRFIPPLALACTIALSSSNSLIDQRAHAEDPAPTPAVSATPVGALSKDAPTPALPPLRRFIEYKDDKLTVKADSIPVREILEELKKQSGATLTGELHDSRHISIEVVERPLNEALESLLGSQNFKLTYASDGRLKEIDLRGLEQERKPAQDAAQDLDARMAPPAEWSKLENTFFASPTKVPVSGDLAKLFGTDTANWDLTMNTAVGYKEGRLRREAVRAGLRAIDSDPALKSAVLDMLKSVDPSILATYARSACYHMCDQFLRNIYIEARDREIRAAAKEIRSELRRQPFKGPRPEMH